MSNQHTLKYMLLSSIPEEGDISSLEARRVAEATFKQRLHRNSISACLCNAVKDGLLRQTRIISRVAYYQRIKPVPDEHRAPQRRAPRKQDGSLCAGYDKVQKSLAALSAAIINANTAWDEFQTSVVRIEDENKTLRERLAVLRSHLG